MKNDLVGFLEFLATECPLDKLIPTGKTVAYISIDELIYYANRYYELCEKQRIQEGEL